MIGIYKFTNKLNNKSYIGQSINIENRYRQHLTDAFNVNANDYTCPFHNALRKYDVSNFEFEILCECSEAQLDELECFYISLFNSSAHCIPGGYNLALGGKSRRHFSIDSIVQLYNKGYSVKLIMKHLGCSHTTVQRALHNNPVYSRSEMQNRKINQWLSDFSFPVYEYTLAGDFVQKHESLSAASKSVNIAGSCIMAAVNGKTKYAADRQWGREFVSKIPAIANYLPHTRSIDQFTLDGIFIKTWPAIAEAARCLGIKKSSNISLVCRGKRRCCGGFYWQYHEDN